MTRALRERTAVLGAMGKTVTHLGPVGSGQWAKAINQVILCGVYLGVAEGVTLGLKAGLDVEKVISAIKGGAAGSWVLENRSPRMIDDDYPLGFKISLHRKDLGIGLELAQSVGATLPVTALGRGLRRRSHRPRTRRRRQLGLGPTDSPAFGAELDPRSVAAIDPERQAQHDDVTRRRSRSRPRPSRRALLRERTCPLGPASRTARASRS